MAFTPNQVPIYYTLNIDQVNLILAAMGKLPYEQVSDMVAGIRAVALQALQAAEAEAMAETQKADEAAKTTEVIDQTEPNDPGQPS